MTPTVTVAFAEAIAVMALLGFFTVELLLPSKAVSRWLVWALAPPVGAGICSLILFLFRRPMFTVERGLLLVLLILWIWKRRPRVPSFSQILEWRIPFFGALFAVAIVLVLALSIERTTHIPHGNTDGWAIWNSHSRYLYRDGPSWERHIHNTFHADYPLLLPLNVARVWRYAGEDVPDMGAVLGVLFAFFGIAVLGASVAELRGPPAGLLMALTLLTTSFYMVQGTYQEADVPLSVFFLCAIALIYLYFEQEPARPGFLILAGFMTGCAAWTKNEGLVLLIAVSFVLLLPVLWNPRAALRRVALFSAGLALPLAVLAYFKLTIAPQNDLAESFFGSIVQRLLTLDRHAVTFWTILRSAWVFGSWAIHPIVPLSAFLMWRGVNRHALRSHGWLAGVAIVGLILKGYYGIYVLIGWQDLVQHLDSSLNRLLLHLWPSVILLIGLAAKKRETLPGSGPA